MFAQRRSPHVQAMKATKSKMKYVINPELITKAMKVMKAMKGMKVAGKSGTGGSNGAGSKDKMKTLCEFLTGPDAAAPKELETEKKTTKTKKGIMKKLAANVGAAKLEEEKVDGTRDRSKLNHFQKYYDDLPSEVRELYESATSGI